MSVELRKTRLGDVYTIRYRANGQQIRETLGLKEEGWTKRKALAVEKQRIVESRNVHLRNQSVPFVSLAWRWYDETGSLKAWKPRTLMAYRRSIERLQHFHDMTVDQVTGKTVAEFITEHRKTYSGKTSNFDVSVLYAIFEYACLHELLKVNPAARAPRPKNGKRKWRILTPEEIQKVDSCFEDEQARLMFRVLTRTAIRRHELRQLKVKDFDPSRKILRIEDSKTEEGVRSIALPESLSKQLEEWIERG